MPKSFVPDKDEETKITLPSSFVPDEVDSEELPEAGLLDVLGDKVSQFAKDHPKIKEIGERLLTGTSSEYEEMLKERGIPKVLGTPESESSLLPSWKSQPETFAGGFLKSLYQDFAQPLATPSGVVGSADTVGFNPLDMGVRRGISDQKLLPPATRFHAGPEGITDINTTPLRRSTEIPYRAPESLVIPESTNKVIEAKLKKTSTDAMNYRNEFEPWKGARIIGDKANEVGELLLRPFESPGKIVAKADSLITKEPKEIPITAADKVIERVDEVPIVPKEEIVPKSFTPEIVEDTRIHIPEVITEKAPITIDNAPPTQRAKMFRGMHDPVDILFTNPESREIFGAGQSGFSKGFIKPGVMDRIRAASDRVSQKYGISALEAGKHIRDYNEEVRNLGKALPKQGEDLTFTAPTFDEFVAKRIPSDIPPNLQGEVGMSGGLFAIGGKGGGSKKLPPRPGPVGAVVDKLMSSLQASKGLRTKQDKLYSVERAKRFAAFEGVKEGGALGARKSLGKLSGELGKINRSALELGEDETDILFNAVKRANITSGEKATGYTALFKILDGGSVPQRNEIKILGDVFGGDFANEMLELHGGLGATSIKLAKTANTMKALSSSLDISAPLRQGIGLLHKKEWRDSFKEMFKYLNKEEYYKASMKALEDRPTYLLGRESGLFLAKPDNLLQGEEAFMKSYIHNIPFARNLVNVSERGYTGFLNKLRADTFDNMIKQASALGHQAFTVAEKDGAKVIMPSESTRAIARYINNATGRGSLGMLEKAAPELNMLLWSPRLISSRISMLTNPKIYTDMPKGMRLDSLKSLLAIAALGTTTGALGALAGGKVGTNLLSSDAGKVRFGNKVLDVYGGFQQPIVAAARFLAGRTNSRKQDRFTTALNFGANKLSPMASLAYELSKAQKFTGKSQGGMTSGDGSILPQAGGYTDQYGNDKFLTEELEKKFLPILTQDLFALATEDPGFAESVGLNSVLAGMAAIGAGVQDYPEQSNARKMSVGKMRMAP